MLKYFCLNFLQVGDVMNQTFLMVDALLAKFNITQIGYNDGGDTEY